MKKNFVKHKNLNYLNFLLWALVSCLTSTFTFYLIALIDLDLKIHAAISCALILFQLIFFKDHLRTTKVFHFVLSLAILAILNFLPIYDLASDSISIYNTAQEMIFRDWNFIQDPFGERFSATDKTDFAWENPSYVSAAAKTPYALRNQFYWLIGANSVYLVNLLLLALLILFIRKSHLLKQFKPGFPRAIILIATISPTIAAQFFSSYSDFYIAVFSTIILFANLEKTACELDPESIRKLNGIIWASAGLLLNSKLSGFLATLILLFIVCFSLKSLLELRDFLRNRLVYVFVLGVTSFGFQILFNSKVFQDPFFPVGKSTTSILMGSQTGFIFELQPVGFLKSHFGIPSVSDLSALAPQWISNLEGEFLRQNRPILSLGEVDTRVSGFGIGFGIILIYVIYLLFKDIRINNINRIQSGFLLLVTLLVPLIPGSYWARLIVYLYPIVLVVLIREQIANKSGVGAKPNLRYKETTQKRLLSPSFPIILIALNSISATYASTLDVYTNNQKLRAFIALIEMEAPIESPISVSGRNSYIPNTLMREISNLNRGPCTEEQSRHTEFETWVCWGNRKW